MYLRERTSRLRVGRPRLRTLDGGPPMARRRQVRTSRLGMWPPLPLDVYWRRAALVLPFPLEEPGCQLLRKARQALFHGVQMLGLEAGHEILMPAYHHGSEVEALLQAGLVCRFYDVGSMLSPDRGELEALVGSRTRALYLIHYLGFPQDAPGWLAWCRERGLLLIEDTAQGWLGSIEGRPLGSFGDLAIFSFYKSIGVPDGGALVSRRSGAASFDVHLRDNYKLARKLARRHRDWLTSRSSLVAALDKTSNQSWLASMQAFNLGDPDAGLSGMLRYLLPRLLEPDPMTLRRRNYQFLLDELAGQVPHAFALLPDGTSPYFFPVHTEDKAGLLARLNDHGIGAVDFWPFPHPSLDGAQFPQAARLRSCVIGVPVHQELRLRDLERIVTAVGQRPPSVRRAGRSK